MLNSKNLIDLYWNNHTVAKKSHETEVDSIAFLEWRNSQYPLSAEFMQLNAKHINKTILDFGCGPGNDLVSFLTNSQAKSIIGIDISKSSLLHAKKRILIHKTNNNISLINTSDSNYKIPLKNNTIDFIHCAGALHHTSNPQLILHEFYRILKDDGKCNIMVYNKNSIWFNLYVAYVKKILEKKFPELNNQEAFAKLTDGDNCPISNCYDPEEFSKICKNSGFQVNYIGGYLSLHELKLLSKYQKEATQDKRLPVKHRDFLSKLKMDKNGLPKINGFYAGIGGVFRLSKTTTCYDRKHMETFECDDAKPNNTPNNCNNRKLLNNEYKVIKNKKINILILLHNKLNEKNREIINDLINCYKLLNNSNTIYVNFYYNEKIPRNIKYDVVVFHTLLLIKRYQLNVNNVIPESEAKFLNSLSCIKIALPQDEHYKSNFLNEIINKFSITHIFSVSPAYLWNKIYDKIDPNKTKLYNVLTGYVNTKTLNYINSLKHTRRTVDVCYRSIKVDRNNVTRFWLGRHGNLKWQIAELFLKCANHTDLKTDISIDPKKILLEKKWYDLLLSSKFIIGVEGGSSIHDPSGSIYENTINFLHRHPKANFLEIEQNCFPNLDGQFRYTAMSPRHLEACATRTCQILIEGDYNGILKPWEHYIPLKEDFSNIIQVINCIKSQNIRKSITERAYNDIILSEKYTYEKFVKYVISSSLE